jgi:uncharacterized protein YndB with AHSA1/START domain
VNSRSADQVEVERKFNASAKVLFRVLSQAKFVQQWFFPDEEFRLSVEQFDFTVGGQYRFHYTLPDGSVSVVEGKYTRIVPDKRIEFTWTWLPPDPHAGIQTLVSMALEEQCGETTLRVTHERLPKDYSTIFVPGWKRTLEHLAAIVEKT